METLHKLLHSLSKGELEVLRASLKSFAAGKAPEKRSLKLVEVILKCKKGVPSTEKISNKIYGPGALPSRLSMLKSRLKEKVIDSFLNDINLSRIENIDANDLAMIRVRKKLAQFQYLQYSKPTLSTTREILEDVIAMSKEFELYSTLVEALKYKKWLAGFRQGEREFEKTSKEVVFYDQCNLAVNKATDYYYRLIMKSDFSGNVNSKKLNEFMLTSIHDLKSDFTYTGSSVVQYYAKTIEFAYYEANNNYLKGRSACLELINIIRSSKAVYRKQRIGIAYNHISQCETLLRNYGQAIEYAKLAQGNMIEGTVNFHMAQDHEFHALFYDKQYKRSELLSKEMISRMNTSLGDFRYAKYRFYHANALFAQGKFKEALRILNAQLELSSDKTGWDIAARVMAVMCNVELNDEENASRMVENLRKHIEYNSKQQELKERDARIVKVLYHLQKNGFRYDKSNSKLVANSDLLKEKKLAWEPFSPELIPFHEWLERKYRLKRTVEKVSIEA